MQTRDVLVDLGIIRGANVSMPHDPPNLHRLFDTPIDQPDTVWDRQTRGIRAIRSAPLGGTVKRMMDIAIVVPTLVVALPFMVLIAIMIRLTSHASPLFAHQRVGFGGRMFPCYKFRTMVPNAEAALAKHLAEDPDAAREWERRRKLRYDPRVTRLGRILRKLSLDEFPQLFNVLVGDMSCVGPRPVTEEELARYGDRVNHYLSTRPGITGLWQVNGRSSTDFATRVAIDEHYVRNWTVARDLAILAKTPAAVLRIMDVH